MFSVARLSREMYNTFGLFVFGSFVNQLLTDTTKYTIGWFCLTHIKSYPAQI